MLRHGCLTIEYMEKAKFEFIELSKKLNKMILLYKHKSLILEFQKTSVEKLKKNIVVLKSKLLVNYN